MTDSLVSVPDGAKRAEVAGYELGKRLTGGQASFTEAAARVGAFLERQGFEPEQREDEIWMHRCPFLDVVLKDDAHQAVVCGLHHGLVQGALDGLGGTAEVAEFAPFKTPHACLVRLQQRNAGEDR